MQTSKFLVATGTAVALILPLQISAAPDSAEQAQMRAALRQKMEELNTTTAKPAVVTPAPVAPAPNPPLPQPVPAAPPAAAAPEIVMFEKPATVPPPADDAEAAKAREAVRQKMKELQTGAPQTAVSAPAPAPVVAAAPAPNVEKPMAPVPPPVNDAALAGAEAAVRTKLTELKTTTPPKVAATPASQKIPGVAPAAEYAPIQAPASPLSAAQQAQLADLLARYKADTITALEYHTQRAAILSKP